MKRARKQEWSEFDEWRRHIEAGISTLSSTPVVDVMRRGPRIHEAATEDALVEVMIGQGVHGVPVVDDSGFLVGFVSTTDIVRVHHDEDGEDGYQLHERLPGPGFHTIAPQRTVSDLMTPVAVDVLQDASVATAALLMATHHLHQLPVVSDDGRLAGILTATDVLFWLHDKMPRRRATKREVH